MRNTLTLVLLIIVLFVGFSISSVGPDGVEAYPPPRPTPTNVPPTPTPTPIPADTSTNITIFMPIVSRGP